MTQSPGFTKCLAWLVAAAALSGCVQQPALQTADEAERLGSAGLLPEEGTGSALLRAVAGAPADATTIQVDGARYGLGAVYDSAGGLRCRNVLGEPGAGGGRLACEGSRSWQWAAPVAEVGAQ